MGFLGLRRSTTAGIAVDDYKVSAVLAALVALNVIGIIAIVAITLS